MMRMINSCFKGSVTAEASLVFPVMMICLLPFIYLFRMLLCQMVLEKGLDECVKQLATEMYVLERVSILPEYKEEEEQGVVDQTKAEQLRELIDEYTAFFEEEGWKENLQEWGYEFAGEMLLKQRLQKWLETENLIVWGIESGWAGISITESEFLYEEEGHHYLIKGGLSVEWKTMFSFWSPEKVLLQRVYHCFVGEDTDMYSEEENQGESNEEVVYRIGRGTKYHISRCYLINKNVYTSTRSQAELDGKQPCERCTPDMAITVYQTGGGECYHVKNCSYLNPDIITLGLEEAIQLGYTGCGLCQGEKRYFS